MTETNAHTDEDGHTRYPDRQCIESCPGCDMGVLTGYGECGSLKRYELRTSPNEFNGGGFQVWDLKEDVEVCVCGERRHSTMIIETLELMEGYREYSDIKRGIYGS